MSKKNRKRRSKQMPATRVRESEKKAKTNKVRLELWQKRLSQSNTFFSPEVEKMDRRERIYNGDRKLTPLVPGEKTDGPKETSHVRNIVFENIESQISTVLPPPKVTPMRKKDEHLADIIEHFLRNELDRLPFEMINDMAERTSNIQGGVLYWPEWDNSKRTHCTVGELKVSVVHPKQLGPQPGIYTGIDDMDWFIIKLPTTKDAIFRKYGIDVFAESESEPGMRSANGEGTADEAVTQYIGYERNENGKIDKYSWVNDTELEDLENYQARRQPVCCKCGKVKPLPGQIIYSSTPAMAGNLLPNPDTGFTGGLIPEEVAASQAMAQTMAEQVMAGDGLEVALADVLPVAAETPPEPTKYNGGPCPWCGSEKFTTEEMEFEQVFLPMKTTGGVVIPGASMGLDDEGNPEWRPTQIPFYQPDVFPIVLQRSVSVFGQLLGNSDVDVIADQQNTINRLEQKIITRLIQAGTRVTLPNDAALRLDPKDGCIWRLKDIKQKQVIDVYTFSGDLQYELIYLDRLYEESRQILGITDSFQGRADPTATSGKAKEFAAAQSAGRLESKRVMKNAAFAKLYEIMFKHWLAYSDEPRPVIYKNANGESVYEEFNRYDFLEQDEDGTYWWNDRFLFSVDTAAPLANNREALWQETRLNLQTGAFGDPTSTDTLILFWTKMESYHYPGAGEVKTMLEKRRQLEQQQMQAMLQAQASRNAAAGQGLPAQGMLPGTQMPTVPAMK